MELIIGMAIAAVVASLTISTMRSTTDSRKKTQDIVEKKTFLSILSQPLNLSSVGVNVDSLDLARTLAGSYPKNDNTDLSKSWRFMTTTAQSPNFKFRHKGQFYSLARNSHSMDLAFADEKMNESNRGAFLARCAEASLIKKRKKKPWSISEVLSLNRFPILHMSGNETNLNCCRIENKVVFDCQKVDKNSRLRSRVFRITEDNVSVWPSENAPYPIFSSGFFRHLNDPLRPSLMKIHTFVAGNPCIYNSDFGLSSENSLSANSSVLCEEIKIEASSKDAKIERNFYDSGIISIGN